MITLCKGNTRWAFIVLDLIVVKVPNPRFDWVAQSFRYRKSFPSFMLDVLEDFYRAFVWGTVMNASEALLSLYHKDGYLAPVVFLGFCNVQRYQGEECPTRQEIQAFYESFPDDVRKILDGVNCHDSSSHNWRKTKKGLVLIDYALDPLRTDWARFLKLAHNQLERERKRAEHAKARMQAPR
jgi:hypothetical protein